MSLITSLLFIKFIHNRPSILYYSISSHVRISVFLISQYCLIINSYFVQYYFFPSPYTFLFILPELHHMSEVKTPWITLYLRPAHLARARARDHVPRVCARSEVGDTMTRDGLWMSGTLRSSPLGGVAGGWGSFSRSWSSSERARVMAPATSSRSRSMRSTGRNARKTPRSPRSSRARSRPTSRRTGTAASRDSTTLCTGTSLWFFRHPLSSKYF